MLPKTSLGRMQAFKFKREVRYYFKVKKDSLRSSLNYLPRKLRACVSLTCYHSTARLWKANWISPMHMRLDENWWETEFTRELLHRRQAVPGTVRDAAQAQNSLDSQNPEGTHRDAAQTQNSQNPEEHTEMLHRVRRTLTTRTPKEHTEMLHRLRTASTAITLRNTQRCKWHPTLHLWGMSPGLDLNL